MSRAQSTLDFAVGVSVFLLVVVAVFAFVPEALAPFEGSAQEETATGDRLATQLATGGLGEYDEPYVLDRECTVLFFESSPGADPGGDDGENTDGDGTYSYPLGPDPGDTDPSTFEADCNFGDVPLTERLGLSVGQQAQVRLVADLTTDADDETDVLCLDSENDAIVESGDPTSGACDRTGGDDDVLFAVSTGSTPSGSVVSARRAVSIEGGTADGERNAVLVVEVW